VIVNEEIMKELKLIYNPNAGDKSFKNNIDKCVEVFQDAQFNVQIHRSTSREDIYDHILNMPEGEFDTLVVCGGDGTINIAVNAVMRKRVRPKLGIIPAGTANDYAAYLQIPKDIQGAANVIANGNTMVSDIGLVNDRYFINVCGAGLLTNISQHIDEEFKNTLGKLAYYIKGIEQVQNFVPMPVRVTNSSAVIEANVYLLLVLNSAGAGSFGNLVPGALVNDGLFDFIALKEMPVKDIAKLFFKIIKSDHLNDENVIYFKDKYIKIESINLDYEKALNETDIDGEMGPDMPIEIRNIPSAISVYCPNCFKDFLD
jgi:YegS/Rv2252/BmrU family lipid kinase